MDLMLIGISVVNIMTLFTFWKKNSNSLCELVERLIFSNSILIITYGVGSILFDLF